MHVFSLLFVKRNVHSRSAGRPTIQLLKEEGVRPCGRVSALWPEGQQVVRLSWHLTFKTAVSCSATRGGKSASSRFRWQTFCGYGGREGRVFLLHPSVHRTEWAGRCEQRFLRIQFFRNVFCEVPLLWCSWTFMGSRHQTLMIKVCFVFLPRSRNWWNSCRLKTSAWKRILRLSAQKSRWGRFFNEIQLEKRNSADWC